MAAPKVWDAFERLTADDLNTLTLWRGAILRRAANQSINASAWTAISWDTEDRDGDGLHSLVTNPTRLTIPADWPTGLWAVTVSVVWAATTGSRRLAGLSLNGAAAPDSTAQGGEGTAPAQAWPIRPAAFYAELAAGQYCEAMVFQDTAGALNMTAKLVIEWRGRTP
jgi:hypothetical protein